MSAELHPSGPDTEEAASRLATPTLLTKRVADLVMRAGADESAGRLDEAERALAEGLSLLPAHDGALHQLGVVRFKQGRVEEAVALIERAIAIAPDTALYHRNICEAYRLLGQYDDAAAAGREAVALAPDDPHCHRNVGVVHYHRLELDEAIASAERALALAPDLPGAHFGIAEASLLRGEYRRGWEEYEWRFRLANSPPLMPPTERPQWNGQPLTSGRLMLIADQGYGDVIQFSRFIPWAARRCPDLVVACSSEIRPVIAQQPGVVLMFDHWGQCPDFAAYCPLSGLPRLCGTTLETIPAQLPALRATPEKIAAWADRLASLVPQGYRRIGIVWAGRPTHANDRNRSASLAAFAPLTDIDSVAFLSLQKGAERAQVSGYWGQAPMINLGPEIGDFADTMAIIASLDLVVTVDTAVAHLAGAMAKPVWIILPFAPDWRWLLDRSDSPWYPSVHLFRQGAGRQWEPVMAAIASRLRSDAAAGR